MGLCTVESVVSAIFLPISLFIQSDCWLSPLELMPGTTRGIAMGIAMKCDKGGPDV